MVELLPVANETVKKVAIGIPLKGHTPPKSYNDRMLMAFTLGQEEMRQRGQSENPRYEFYWFFAGEIFVPFAREHLASLALRYGCDYLFMVDDDMLAPFDLFYKLVKHDRDIVSALAFTRNPPHQPVLYELRQGWDPVSHGRYYTQHPVLNYPRNALVQCDAVGFGAVLIKTEWFRKLEQPWFMSSNASGEDILFCAKAREKGAKIFCDTSQKLGHLSDSIVVTEDYADKYTKMSEADREQMYGKYQRYETLEMER